MSCTSKQTTQSLQNTNQSGTSATNQNANQSGTTSQTQGPAQWMQDEGQNLYAGAQQWIPPNYVPPTFERVADYGPDFETARQMIENGAVNTGDLSTAGTVLDQLRAAPGNDTTKSVSDYINPFIAGVLDPSLRKLEEAHAVDNKMNLDPQATMAGAYGDTGYGIQKALSSDRFNQSVSDLTSKTYSDAWNAGQNQQNTVLSRMMQMPGLYEALSGAKDNHATTFGNYLASFGKADQALQQAKDNVAYNDYTTAQNYPQQRIAALMQLLDAAPHSTTSTGSTSSSSTGASNTNSTATGQTQGTQTTEKPDNTGLQLLGKLGGTVLGSIFGGPTGLGSQIAGGLGGLFGS